MRPLTFALVCVLASCTTKSTIGLPNNLATEDINVPLGSNGKLDLLFMVDNSPSMDAMQAALQKSFGALVTTLSGATSGQPIDLHIGVVTSDYGAGDVAGAGCDASPGGQKGLLQAIGAAAATGCQAPTGTPYISYQVASNGTITSNLPGGNTVSSLETTFTCMASVGAQGCGFEAPLESVYAALHNTNENAGFLRDDAALSIVFLTNEDDSSAPPTADFFNPSAADDSVYGDYTTYRQTHFGVSCGGISTPEWASNGLLTDCVPTPNLNEDPSAEYDVSRYTSFFSQPSTQGGLKSTPWLVSLIEIAGPTTPFQTILAIAGTGNGQEGTATYVSCSPLEQGKCIVALQHAAQNQADSAFFADPPIRLDAVVKASPVNYFMPIVGDDVTVEPDYSSGMSQMGSVMLSQLSGGCIYQALVDSQQGCTVTMTNGTATTAIAPCIDGADVCWQVQPDGDCPAVTNPSSGVTSQQRLVVTGATNAKATCRVYVGD